MRHYSGRSFPVDVRSSPDRVRDDPAWAWMFPGSEVLLRDPLNFFDDDRVVDPDGDSRLTLRREEGRGWSTSESPDHGATPDADRLNGEITVTEPLLQVTATAMAEPDPLKRVIIT